MTRLSKISLEAQDQSHTGGCFPVQTCMSPYSTRALTDSPGQVMYARKNKKMCKEKGGYSRSPKIAGEDLMDGALSCTFPDGDGCAESPRRSEKALGCWDVQSFSIVSDQVSSQRCGFPGGWQFGDKSQGVRRGSAWRVSGSLFVRRARVPGCWAAWTVALFLLGQDREGGSALWRGSLE